MNEDNNVNIAGGFSCPLPNTDYDTVQMAHGSGGRLMCDLIDKIFIKCFENDLLIKMEDQANITLEKNKITFTTDSFVVDPIIFPGGNIGELAVNGTVNDLCMSGAKPLYLSAGFIIEEGFPIKELHEIVISMRRAADKAGVKIVTGDTKVVNKGSCDKVFINTSGVGIHEKELSISASNLRAGDKIIISGTIADHGMAIMTTREGLSFENRIASDTAALNSLVETITSVSSQIRAMRDPTRGGVAATLNEFAKQSNIGIRIYSDKIPVKENVKGACEILGIDPLYVANEGKLIAVVAPEDADKVLSAMQGNKLGRDAEIIGEVTEEFKAYVVVQSLLGVDQILDMPLGEQLPRIC